LNLIRKTTALLAVSLTAAGLMASASSAASAAAPKVVTPPTVTGTARVGRVLTANNGTWEGNPTSYAYQWQRCTAEGAGCVNITGATAKTYTAVAADVDRTLRVGVIASNADGGTTAYSAATDVVSANTVPRNTARPTISGTTQVGETLTVSNGTWTGGVRSYAYQWQRCNESGASCVAVSGATGRTYGVRAADQGSTMRVEVTATNLAGSAAVTTDRSGVIRGTTTTTPTPTTPTPTPAANKKPRISVLSARFIGPKIYVRVRVCDEPGTLRLFERDSKPGAGLVTRPLASGRVSASCAVFARNWRPAARFQKGRILVTLWARDAKGANSNLARVSLSRR
jgi:hypothetical protein